MPKTSIIIISTLAICVSTASASSSRANKKELTQLNNSIATVKAALSKQQLLRDLNEKKLKNSELSISALSKKRQATNKKLKHEQLKLKNLSSKTNNYQQLITQQKAQLAQLIRSTYLLPQPSFLKSLLAANRSEDIERIRVYSSRLAQSEAATIKQLSANMEDLRHYQQKSQQQTQLLQHLKNEQQKQHHALQQLKRHRQQIIDSISNNISTKKQRLAELDRNKTALEATIRQLKQHRSTPVGTYFDKLKGKLPQPISGKLITHYGSQIANSELTSSGIVIQSTLDQPVHVIANGTVAFSNWLVGYGLLLIVDHGNGYMSLYGRNHNLYKQAGEVVHQGDVIASVGTSGGYQQPALYFAIRHNAEPEDPQTWFIKKEKHSS